MANRVINICWFCFKWGLIASVIAAALLVPYFYHRMDEEIRCRIERLLAKQYPGLQLKIRSAVLMKGEGISVRGLSIVDPAAEGPCAELLTYDECFIACPTDLSDLLGGEPRPTRVVLRRPTLRMTRRSDGTWSASRLLPLPRLSNGAMPEIRVENGTIEVFDPTCTPACSHTFREVNLTLSPIPTPDGQPETTRRRHIQGTATGDYFRQITFDGEIDVDRPTVDLSGKVEGMEISPEMRNLLPDVQGCDLSLLGSLRGETEAQFHVSYDPTTAPRWKFDVTGQLVRGRIDDPRLKRPLTEIQATVHVDNGSFSVRDLKARSNQATLSLACSGGLTPASPMDIEAEIHQLPLDEQLLAILPPKLQKTWSEIKPKGVIDANIALHCDERVGQPRVRVKCQDVSFAHDLFPYPLEHGNGLLELNGDHLTLDLLASSENQPVRLVGDVRNLSSGANGWLRVRCDALPLDEKLWGSMKPEPQALARKLDLRGTVVVDLVLSQDVANGPLHKHLRVWPNRNRCALRYADFPFALSNITGQLEMVDGKWSCRNLEGYNGTTCVTGEGSFAPSPNGDELLLRLFAGNVPLEGELREALPREKQEVWTLLRPHGFVNLTAGVRYIKNTKLLDVSVRAEPCSDTCSLEPDHFPYRLENVQGVFTYGSGQVSFERASASHGPMKLACSGTCSFQPDGGWQFRLDRLAVDHLRLDRQFMQVMPPQYKKSLGELNATGPISVQGNVVVTHGAQPGQPIISQWDLSLGLNQVGLDCGVRLENLYGKMDVNGWSDGTRYQMRGELAIESMTYRDFQVTQVLGPFWIDEQKALFGSWVAWQENQALPPGQSQQKNRPITAKAFGGTIDGDGWAMFGDQPRYNVRARVLDADLAACDRELAGKNRNLRGRVDAAVQVEGAGRSRTAMRGKGELHLRNANIYELPAMVAMLKFLSFKPADPNAFTNCDSTFDIEGEHLYFSKLDFNGDAISLSGKGEMDVQGILHMVFTATLGRGDAGVPLLHNLFRGVNQQIMQIHVTGNLQEPHMSREAFPGVNQALKNLQEQ